jgi:hypothetical protein
MVMKRILLGLLFIAASTQLKAQQLLQLKPDVKLSNGLQNYFKPEAAPSPKSLLLQPLNTEKPTQSTNSNNIVVYSKMPVVKVASTDRMPVAVLGDPNTKYTMLVKKVEINPVAPAKDPQP